MRPRPTLSRIFFPDITRSKSRAAHNGLSMHIETIPDHLDLGAA
jgi:hypothetical protein